ncbi:MAG: hypothetical protein NVSMB1_24330 [Polyangiales bacterium]
MRRLTRAELTATITDIVGIAPSTALMLALPPDNVTPFDNDFQSQSVSSLLISSLNALAEDMATRVTTDPAAKAALVKCTPSGPGDETCFQTVAQSFGRRALRRPLLADEVALYTKAFVPLSVQANDFYVGVGRLVSATLQDVEFIYRIENGTPLSKPGFTTLTDFQIATRLSYLFWGRGPDDALLDKAAAGGLHAASDRKAVAAAMLNDPRGRGQVNRIHAMWLGYEYSLPQSASIPAPLQQKMRAETDALITRVVLEKNSSWFDLFKSDQTFLDDTLAKHYGDVALPGSQTATWAPYGAASKRRGILSHGSFLSVAAKFDDTSPTQRGKFVRTRLLCTPIQPPPPDLKVDVNTPPAGGKCKADAYNMSRVKPCSNCHTKMDPIGFGLEQYDATGTFRTHDTKDASCQLDGKGVYAGNSGDVKFEGPAGLEDMILTDPTFDDCFMSGLFSFVQGRQPDSDDAQTLSALTTDYRGSDRHLKDLLINLVAAESFAVRQEAQ